MNEHTVPGPDDIRDALADSRIDDLRIVVKDFLCAATIGVTDTERAQRQKLGISLELVLTPSPPLRDDITEVLNYGTVVRTLRRLCQESEYRLLETLAEALAGAFFVHQQVVATRIRLVKHDRYPDLDGVGIEIARRRNVG
jgi:FolB domain-containing protein